ncbi:MAG: tetratricopeptide repeat protein, partial [Anaerolineales bacterium]|nr:tetratricopeptide repeat protein [Anaerolineales bacterium]
MIWREQMGYTWGAAATLSNMGVLAASVGHWQKAQTFFTQSLHLRKEMGDVEGVAITLNNLGHLHKDLGAGREAEGYFRESLQMATLFKMPFHVTTAYDGLAQALLQQGDIDAAHEMVEAGLAEAQAIDVRDLTSDLYRIWAEILLARAQLEQALHCAQKAIALATEVGNRAYQSAACRVATDVYLQQNNLQEALVCVERARALWPQEADELEAAHVAAAAGLIYRRLHRDEESANELRIAKQTFQLLNATYYQLKLEEALANFV